MEEKSDRLNSLYQWLRKNPVASINVLHLLKQRILLGTKEISIILGLSQPTVTKMLASMQTKGWIEIKKSDHDMRTRVAVLTESGSSELKMKIVELESIMGQII